MAGHSKWNNIKRKKEKSDGQKGKIFTKIGREIAVAIKEGGADPAGNSKLRDAIAKAKANNIPNDNIERAIKKAASGGEQNNYENNIYEGYGPGGIALMVETLTDNKNRTAGDMRHYFDKCGGNLGQTGSVSFMFDLRGLIVLAFEEDETPDEEKLMEHCMEAGAEDFTLDSESAEIFTHPNDVSAAAEKLRACGYNVVLAERSYIPSSYTKPESEEVEAKMNRLLDMLDDNDDVQNVWHNTEE